MTPVIEGPAQPRPAPAPLNLRNLAAPPVPQPDLVLEDDGETAWAAFDRAWRETRDGVVGEGF